jgi:hypothetical protein
MLLHYDGLACCGDLARCGVATGGWSDGIARGFAGGLLTLEAWRGWRVPGQSRACPEEFPLRLGGPVNLEQQRGVSYEGGEPAGQGGRRATGECGQVVLYRPLPCSHGTTEWAQLSVAAGFPPGMVRAPSRGLQPRPR